MNSAIRKAYLINSIDELAHDYWSCQDPSGVYGRLIHATVKEWRNLSYRSRISLTHAELAALLSLLACQHRSVER